MTSTPLPLPVLRLLLGVRADEPLTLPAYAGSMLRGALGHALLRQSPLPHDGNQPCALRESCTYCQVFRPLPTAEHTLQKFSALPAPYCIEPPFDAVRPAPRPLAPGQSFEFGLVLIGRAIAHLPALLAAFTSACQRGLDVRAAMKLAETIAANAPIAVRACKKAIDEGLALPMDEAVALEEGLFGSCFETEDQKEGMGAFLEKRRHEPYKNR